MIASAFSHLVPSNFPLDPMIQAPPCIQCITGHGVEGVHCSGTYTESVLRVRKVGVVGGPACKLTPQQLEMMENKSMHI